VLGAVLCLGGCAASASLDTAEIVPPVRYPIGVVGVRDGRAAFRQIYCRINEQVGSRYPDRRPCDDALDRLGDDEPTVFRLDDRNTTTTKTTLVFIPGIFGECVRNIATPFSDSYEELRQNGYRVVVVPAEGRSSSATNAAIIDRTLRSTQDDLVVLGYSKGVSDFMEALQLYADAEWVGRTRAFISVAGVVSGTPIADELEGLYATLLARVPVSTCEPGDKGAVTSLTRQTRMSWLSSHRLPETIEYFSVVAYPTTSALNPLLAPFHSHLSLIDARNDGQVLIEDAVLPKSHLLAYVNADHWAVAMPFNRSTNPGAAFLAIGNAFPREVLLQAILAYVAQVRVMRN